EHISTDLGHLKHVLLTAEAAGFEGALVPYSFRNYNFGGENPYIATWTAASALGVVTTKIRLLIAVLTGMWHPWLLARAATTLDHFTGGRIDLNIISGGKEEPGIGDPLAHDRRYDRT